MGRIVLYLNLICFIIFIYFITVFDSSSFECSNIDIKKDYPQHIKAKCLGLMQHNAK